MRLGIDFGTTRTVVSGVTQGRYPVAAFDTFRGYLDYLPGLAASDGRTLHYGWDARQLLEGNARAAVQSVKRTISALAPEDEVPEFPGVTALQLATGYLEHLRRWLVDRSNLELDASEPLEVMVAVPANAPSRQRFLTLEAFKSAGFEVAGMLNEPTAAGIEFAHRNLGAVGRRSPKRYVVVYDLGGGTFDTSAVSLEGRRFDLLRSEGIAQLGGNDFDAILLEMALEAAGLDATSLPATARACLLDICREAKESASATTRRLLVDLGDFSADQEAVLVDASELYERCQPLVDRTVELLGVVFDSLGDHGIDPENPRELGAVYLVGGATAFPAVSRSLRRVYKRKIQLAPQPHAATSVGLAIAADPDAGLFVREAVTRHFGVWREGNAGRDKVFDAILHKDTAVDEGRGVVAERRYHPVHAVGRLRFVECSRLGADGQPSGDLTPWGELLFPYDPVLATVDELANSAVEQRPSLFGQEIVETYRYAPDGSVTVEIENCTAGYRRSYLVSDVSGPRVDRAG